MTLKDNFHLFSENIRNINYEHPSTKKTATTRKSILHPKTKNKPQQEDRRDIFKTQLNPILSRWMTHIYES